MRFLALATDFDETLAHWEVVGDSTIDALRRFRASGRKLILVTGRHTPNLLDIFPRIDLFDAVIAENGGTLYTPCTRTETLLADPPPEYLLMSLREHGVAPLFPGKVVIATVKSQEMLVRPALQEAGATHEIVFNHGNLMILPIGIDKASGVRAAAGRLGLSLEQVVAVGDAENDEPFLSACGLGVAVANALPALRARAAFVTTKACGEGVVEVIERILGEELFDHRRGAEDAEAAQR